MKPILPLIDELQKEIRQREHILITADTINTIEKVIMVNKCQLSKIYYEDFYNLLKKLPNSTKPFENEIITIVTVN